MLNACGTGLGLMSSTSVVFTDDQALLAEKAGTLYSSASEEAASSIASVNHDDTSRPESQVSKWVWSAWDVVIIMVVLLLLSLLLS